MPSGLRPRVNEAREFLEIAKDFKEPREIIREALSNSWDAGAKQVTLKFNLRLIPGSRRNKIEVEIVDDGQGMSCTRLDGRVTSDIEDFFNLGDSNKAYGSIGTKGHGTKIYYKSDGIIVDTWNNGRHLHAKTEVPPWETLLKGVVPTYCYEEDANVEGKGSTITIVGFQGKQADFSSLDELIRYISWYTVVGSFGHHFGNPRKMDVHLKPIGHSQPVQMAFGFSFPKEDLDFSAGSSNYCKLIGPESIDCGQTQEGNKVTVEIVGAILGEANRGSIPHTYEMMGLWLGKDFIRVERMNHLVEQVFKGQYYYRSMLILANCQQLDLTANRNNIRNDQEEYDLAVVGIKQFLDSVRNDPATDAYFNKKSDEDKQTERARITKQEARRKESLSAQQARRLDEYKGRPDLVVNGVNIPPLKEPRSEADTALLLQAMISSKHPGIDFRIGEYNTSLGTDLLVELDSKGIRSQAWAELVVTLENLFAWSHPPDGIHKVICWDLGKVREQNSFKDGKAARLRQLGNGRYSLELDGDSLEVYVLRQILQAGA